jgi:DUF971 family protein
MLSPASFPAKIKRLKAEVSGIGLEITFSTGEVVTLSSKELRINCPCATCVEKRRVSAPPSPRPALRVLSSTPAEELDLAEVFSIGNYAIGIRWGDRHDSGIYTFELIRELAAANASAQKA